MRSAASVNFITGVTIARAENQAITDTSKMVHPSKGGALLNLHFLLFAGRPFLFLRGLKTG